MKTSTERYPSDKQHRSYLLRIWRADTLDSCWRASLEDPRTNRRFGFPSLEEMFAFLMEQVERDVKGESVE